MNLLTRKPRSAYRILLEGTPPGPRSGPGIQTPTEGTIMTTCAAVRSGLLAAGVCAGLVLAVPEARADGNLGKVNHIIIVMQENHSYDNYFGVLGYVANSPYHNAKRSRGCNVSDNTCVDGLK